MDRRKWMCPFLHRKRTEGQNPNLVKVILVDRRGLRNDLWFSLLLYRADQPASCESCWRSLSSARATECSVTPNLWWGYHPRRVPDWDLESATPDIKAALMQIPFGEHLGSFPSSFCLFSGWAAIPMCFTGSSLHWKGKADWQESQYPILFISHITEDSQTYFWKRQGDHNYHLLESDAKP